MNGEYSWWLLVVGLAIGVIGAWLVRGTLAREDADLAAGERREEAAWISRTIEDAGGIAPADLVEQVLELHRAYLASPAFAMPDPDVEDEAATRTQSTPDSTVQGPAPERSTVDRESTDRPAVDRTPVRGSD